MSGGRSRLHIISLGDAANAKGGLPLSGLGNVLLAVLSGKHVPYKTHPLTVILKECLASFSSNISVITHLSYAQVSTNDNPETAVIIVTNHSLSLPPCRIALTL